MKVTFTLSGDDVDHLRSVMRRSRGAVLKQTESVVIGSALVMAREVRKFKPPEYVLERVERIETFVDMIRDADWALPAAVKSKILGALAYFTEPEDLIADPVPGLGFLDDAIMIELVTQDLKHELAAYRSFCDFRQTGEQRPWTRSGKHALERRIGAKRRQLRERIERNQIRDASRARDGGRKGPFRLW